MEYRKLPHGEEELSTIGLGLGNIHTTSTDQEIEETVGYAVDQGVNLFDLCCGRVGAFESVGKAVNGKRDHIYTQMHFGAAYENDTYEFSRKLDVVKSSFDKVLSAAKFSYTDFGYIHCIDEEDDFNDVMKNGIWDYVCSLKEQGVVHHIGFSTHTPAMARKFLELGVADMFMFSINPAYDYAKGTYGYGGVDERLSLYKEAQQKGVGITVMKPFAGGQLLDQRRSPINVELSKYQCMKYALDRPAVLSCLPGVGSLKNVKEVLKFYDLPEEEKDYSLIGKATPKSAEGRCVYCNHCAPCPKGIDVGLVNKYYDLARIGDELARSHYKKLSLNAKDCVQCGHCETRCPFQVKQMDRMKEIKEYFE